MLAVSSFIEPSIVFVKIYSADHPTEKFYEVISERNKPTANSGFAKLYQSIFFHIVFI
jgi:hypothetical protein